VNSRSRSLYVVVRPSVVCLSSDVCPVRPTQAPNIAILDISNAISQKRCKIGAKFVLITNRKLHMSFRLVPHSVTLDDLERRYSPNRRVISTNSVAFGTDHVKVVEDTPVLTAAEM